MLISASTLLFIKIYAEQHTQNICLTQKTCIEKPTNITSYFNTQNSTLYFIDLLPLPRFITPFNDLLFFFSVNEALDHTTFAFYNINNQNALNTIQNNFNNSENVYYIKDEIRLNSFINETFALPDENNTYIIYKQCNLLLQKSNQMYQLSFVNKKIKMLFEHNQYDYLAPMVHQICSVY
jgi:hypothetical protein